MDNDTIDIGIEVDKLLNNNPKIINATIGVLKNNKNHHYYFKTVYKSIKKLSPDKWFKYPAISGGDDFKRNILNWIFPSNVILDTLLYREVLATSGATGSIYVSLKMFSKPGDFVLIPNLGWPNYETICSNLSLQFIRYDFLVNNKFNINDLVAKLISIIDTNKCNKIFLIINDPCHNPTGYSMSYDEWSELIDKLNVISKNGRNVFLIHDLAYLDYYDSDYKKSRKIFEYLNKINNNFIVSMCFSGSKTFCSYGLRIGALILISKQKLDDFYISSKKIARATWNTPTSLAISVVNTIIGNPRKLKKFVLELSYVNKMLKKRYILFVKYAQKYKFEFYKAIGGFFVSIKVNDSKCCYQKMCNKYLYAIPQDGVIRIALSSVPKSKIRELVDKIGDVICGD